MNVKFSFFENVIHDFIVLTSKRELFQVECLSFNNVDNLLTVKQDAIEILFKSPISISINDSKTTINVLNCDYLIEKLRWFVENANVQNIDLNLRNRNTINMADLLQFDAIRDMRIYYDKYDDTLDLANIYGQLKRVKTLRLCGTVNKQHNNNLIEVLLTNSSSNSIALEQLHLNNTIIRSIDSTAFKQFHHLKELNLSHNKLKSINSDAFKDLRNLIYLNISHNPIKCVENGAFSDLQSLNQLDMKWLILDTIGEFTFDGLTNLETLNISSHKTSAIHPEAFKPLKNLTTINANSKLIEQLKLLEINKLIKI